jgi:hypothetical protein
LNKTDQSAYKKNDKISEPLDKKRLNKNDKTVLIKSAIKILKRKRLTMITYDINYHYDYGLWTVDNHKGIKQRGRVEKRR